MNSSFRNIRALVLIVILGLTVVPTASASVRDGEGPRLTRDRIVRVIKKFLRVFNVTDNSEQITVPRP